MTNHDVSYYTRLLRLLKRREIVALEAWREHPTEIHETILNDLREQIKEAEGKIHGTNHQN